MRDRHRRNRRRRNCRRYDDQDSNNQSQRFGSKASLYVRRLTGADRKSADEFGERSPGQPHYASCKRER